MNAQTYFYTMAPLADQNIGHNGFFIFMGILTILFVIIVGAIVFSGDAFDKHDAWVAIIVYVGFMATPFYFSFIKEYPVPINEKVVATKVSNGITTTGGKYSTEVMFVTYNVKGAGDVSFKVKPGYVYPEHIYLYRNIDSGE